MFGNFPYSASTLGSGKEVVSTCTASESPVKHCHGAQVAVGPASHGGWHPIEGTAAWIFLDSTTKHVGDLSEAWNDTEEDDDLWLDSCILPRGLGLETPQLQAVELTPSDPEEPLQMLYSRVTDEVLLKLHQDGFVIVDQALSPAVCETLRHEMDVLLDNGQMWDSQSYSHEESALHHDICVARWCLDLPTSRHKIFAIIPCFSSAILVKCCTNKPLVCQDALPQTDPNSNDQLNLPQQLISPGGRVSKETTLDFKDVRSYAPTFSRMEHDEGLLRNLRRLPALQDLSMQHLRFLA
eukprot:Skav205433  [mRNA]  locus=scaffold2500:111158:112905:+ [translate_table: standard]